MLHGEGGRFWVQLWSSMFERVIHWCWQVNVEVLWWRMEWDFLWEEAKRRRFIQSAKRRVIWFTVLFFTGSSCQSKKAVILSKCWRSIYCIRDVIFLYCWSWMLRANALEPSWLLCVDQETFGAHLLGLFCMYLVVTLILCVGVMAR